MHSCHFQPLAHTALATMAGSCWKNTTGTNGHKALVTATTFTARMSQEAFLWQIEASCPFGTPTITHLLCCQMHLHVPNRLRTSIFFIYSPNLPELRRVVAATRALWNRFQVSLDAQRATTEAGHGGWSTNSLYYY